jgi:hypothetical protein
MARQRRSDDWGFPRWRGYGGKREAASVRLCDRHGCTKPGDRPAPKSPNSRERWWFCEEHAAEYNRGWNYFEGLTREQAAERERAERGDTAYEQARHWGWAGSGDGSRTRGELDALRVLELDPDADFDAVRAAYRALAKQYHPDRNPGDDAAERMFRAVQAAYDVLRRAEAAKSWKGAEASP